MDEADWTKLLSLCREMTELFSEGIVFIGGIAVAAHFAELDDAQFSPVWSHDGDFFLSLADYADLRDMETVTTNRRLNKHQFIKDGFEFDVYLERNNSLIVPYAEASAAAVIKAGLRVACVEHLLCMKAEAMRDRMGSDKGEKDIADAIRILYAAGSSGEPMDGQRLIYMTEDHFGLIDRAVEQQRTYLSVTRGNAHLAARIRAIVKPTWENLKADYEKSLSMAETPTNALDDDECSM